MSLSFTPTVTITPRPYQETALNAWRSNSGRGVIVLPTGAGKTAIGCLAIASMGERTLVVVPTVDLVEQWARAVREMLGAPREQVTKNFPGDDDSPQLQLFPREPSDILIATYAGTSQHLDDLHDFAFIIFDEVHHLPAPVFRRIAEKAGARYRLGLTATPERQDDADADLGELVGPIVHRESVADLSGEYLARFTVSTVMVDLEPLEQLAYNRGWDAYRNYIRRHQLRMPQGFQQLIKRAARDGGAKKALEGHRTARETALSARNKIAAVRDILLHHHGEQILVFCQHVDLATRVGAELDLPVATHETTKSERYQMLEQFRARTIPVLVATSILDEGVDVPEVSVGIVVSGTGQARQFVQRLGRLIRPQPDKEAILYEIVARNTLEERTAQRRRVTSRKSGTSRRTS